MAKRKYNIKERETAVVIDGNSIRRLRISKNLTRRQLAELLNVHLNVVSNVENGLQNMELVSFCKLAHVLGTSTDKLLKEPPCAMN